ncbi:rCG40840 [Rattus norvegicus]|uniref:RCG40840 n=1 Tax=Rattus norvegicus TaxID=10116 RepID=A6KL12_RAT|nr:rCG40840 [Rattus norvegicus]
MARVLSDPEAFAPTAPSLGCLVVRPKFPPFTYLSSHLHKMGVCVTLMLVRIPRAFPRQAEQ